MHRTPITILCSALLVVAALGATARFADSAQLTRPDPRRPLIILVHGRGYGGLDTATLRRSWTGALASGAAQVMGRSPIGEGDVSLVWYADALDPLSDARCSDTRPGRATMTGTIDEPLGAFLGLTSVLLAALTGEAGGEGAREVRNIAADLQLFGDPDRRCAAEEKLAAALASAARQRRPVVLVAHSMGALVSWSHLQGRAADESSPLPRVHRFVTLGSPVGSPDVRELLVGTGARALALPRAVGSWINVVDAADPFATSLGVSADGLTDVLARQSPADNPHAIEHYLRDPATVAAVVGGWCDAFASASRPAECARLQR